MSIKQINDTTYTADGLGDVKPLVLIGGKTTDKFIPNVNASFYDDEFFINLNRKGKPAVSGKSSSAEIVGDDNDIFHIDDQGRLKWDIEFGECPKSLTLSWEIKCSDAIEFYYQGPLTEEEIKDGCVRPDEIVGSYAVYCDKANNKYKTGKLCHIPRPFVIDANGSREWCAMLITDGVLTITLPELFMQSAVYPVRLDPTIGYTTAGASSTGASRYVVCQRNSITMPEAGTASKIYVYARGAGYANNSLLGYYNDNNNAPGSLADGNKSVSISSTSPAWYNADVSGNLSSGSKYFPAMIINPGDYLNYYYFDSGQSADSGYYGQTATMPDPCGTITDFGIKTSLYLEYTESGSSSGNSYYYQQQQM